MDGLLVSYSTNDLLGIAKTLIEKGKSTKTIAFTGNLGAGKTTLIRFLCNELGVNEYLGSPTFSIVNEYELDSGSEIFHFDCYRITNDEELLDIGWEDYLKKSTWVFVEWPENVKNLLPEHFLWVNIKVDGKKRLIEWKML